ncbi:MAG: redoxin domain-containing protein [Blastocatellia bacterium]|nr:redoxin domain-containing protein [Blastocatellia bacterium]
MAKFEQTDTQVFGISMDSVPANKAFAEKIGVKFPLLSDWDRVVVKDYGLFTGKEKYLRRATFIVDKEGIISHIEEGNTAIDPTSAIEACNVLLKKKK